MKYRCLLFLLVWASHAVAAGVRIEIAELPPLLMPGKPLYMASSLNNWNPGNEEYRMQLDASGVWYIELDTVPEVFEYKFTQGNWTMVEGNAIGGALANRLYDAATEANPGLVRVRIAGWEKKISYTFILTGLPENTPADASFYITGNFNNWDPGNPLYRLYRNVDGTYRTTVYTDLDRIEYKFTRGSMKAIEGRESGKARPNRVLFRESDVDTRSIEVEVDSWEDLKATFSFYSLYDLILLFAVFQGILLIIAIPTIQNNNRAANQWLVVTIAVASLMILLRILGGMREVAEAFTKILLLSDFVLFLYAPLFYLYQQKLLFNRSASFNRQLFHFIPVVLQFFVYLPFFLMQERSLQLSFINQDWKLLSVFVGCGLLGLAWNGYYWWLYRNMLRFYRKQFQTNFSYDQNLSYLRAVHIIQGFCLCLWVFFYLMLAVGHFWSLDVSLIAERSVDGIWLAFSTITYFVGYYTIHQPEVFKVSPLKFSVFDSVEEVTQRPVPGIALPEETEDLSQLKEALIRYMEKEKPYSNPRLSLNELAGKLKLPPHTLSRIINDGFEKNFFDFINGYRVEEFKTRVTDPRYKHFTLLGIAYDVGFNSKTAFNRSFKKIMNCTPSEYFSTAGE